MTLKEIVQKCSWDKLKNTQGVRKFMQHSLADLKKIEPKYTDSTANFNIHFRRNTDSENGTKYDAFILKKDDNYIYALEDIPWEDALSYEVIIAEGQTITDSEAVISILEEMTVYGDTAEEAQKVREEFLEKLIEIHKTRKEDIEFIRAHR
jgi:hypothetical protein